MFVKGSSKAKSIYMHKVTHIMHTSIMQVKIDFWSLKIEITHFKMNLYTNK